VSGGLRRFLTAALVGLAGCPGDDACDWSLPAGDLDRVPLSVGGTGPDDVWVVGGGLGLGGALAAHWDGDAWTRADPATDDSLWWVWPDGAGTVWMVGEHGLVVRRRGPDTTLERIATGAILYGVWGSGPDDVWVVGGIPNGRVDGEDDFVRRWNGTGFEIPPGLPVRGVALFKVWGSGPGDVWLSGEGGTLYHWDGLGFVDHSADLNTLAPALTVHGCSESEVYLVAGQGLYAWNGADWLRLAEVGLGSVANGVACGPTGVLVVGNAGLKMRWDRVNRVWHDERGQGPTGTDLHGAWIDAAGRAWAVGGNFNQPMPTERHGVIGVRGCPAPAPL